MKEPAANCLPLGLSCDGVEAGVGVVAAVNGYDLCYCAADHCWYAAGASGDLKNLPNARLIEAEAAVPQTLMITAY